MGGKAKWRKLKQVVGPAPQGSQPPAKQHFKKERTKTRDAKRRRMGDGGEEEDEEADATADGSKKEPKSTKDPLARSSSKKGQEHLKGHSQAQSKVAAKPGDMDAAAEQKTETSQTKAPDLIQESNGLGEPPEVMVTDLDKEFDVIVAEGLQKPTSEDMLKEEIRQATEEEPNAKEVKEGDPVGEIKTGTLGSPSQEIAKELTPTQKSTQTDAVNMNNVEKPVKFFISDDSDSDTAIFVDANQGALNGANGQPQENAVISPTKEADIAINAVIDVGDESTVEVTVEGRDIEIGIEEATGSQVDGGEAIDGENTAVTQLIDVEPSKSPKISAVQRARFLPSLAQPVKTETQKMHPNLRRHGQSRLAFDPLAEGDNVSRSSASDSVDTVSVTRSSVSDLADQDNISKTSTSESVDHQDGQRKYSTSDSVDLDTTSVTSESIEHETVSKVSITESAEQETMTMSESADAASKMSTTVESADRSTRGSISASESAEPDATSRTSVSESAEGQSKTSYSEYEEAEGITRTSASESGEPDSTSRTSVSESAEFDGTSRTSVSESAEEQSKTSTSVTGTSTSATGEYVTSKSSVSYSSEFDAESLSSTADLLTPKEEVSLTADGKTEQGLDDSSKIEKESPTLTSDTFQEKIEDRPASPAWEELNLEDNMQPIEEGVIPEESPEKGDKKETEPDAESLFFSLYPEYQPGEIEENQDAAQDITTGNPKVLCFRGQTAEQSETQEEIYMAAEKSGIKEGRNKGSVTGKIHQLQRKLSTQKKPEREDKEVPESEGSETQQVGASSGGFKQQDAAEQKSEGSPKEGGSEPSPDAAGGKSLSDVLDSTHPSSTAPTSDAEKAEHSFGKKADDLVCLAGQLGEGFEKLADVAEVAVENIAELGQTDIKPSELISEVEQEAMDGENKLEGNAKDRKTFVGKARDWIKGVTRMGGKKEDSNGKMYDKLEAKKTEAASADESENKKNGNGTKDEKQASPDHEELPAVGAEASEEEKQSGESDSTVTKDNGISLDEQVNETNGGETTSKKDVESTEDTTGNGQEKGETEATKESPTDLCQGENDEKPEEQESKEEGLFDIVGPEEELSDTVFKDDTLDEAGKGKDSDDTEVPDMKTEESAGTEEEKIATPDKVSLTEVIEPMQQSSVTVDNENKGEEKAGNHDVEETGTKESEPQFVSAEEGNETEVMPNTQGDKAEVLQETTVKRRKSSKDEKSRRKRYDKSKSKSPHTEGEKEERASKKDREGKSVGKKRRHRKRTKSQEEPRPEDVPLPPDDFEAEPSPERKAKTEDISGKDGEPLPAEKKKVSSKSRERKHSRKSEEKSGEATEHKRHSRSKREKSYDSKSEKKDKEKSGKDKHGSKERIESPREKLQNEGELQPSAWSPRVDRKDRKSSRKSSDRKKEGLSTERPKIPREKKDDAGKQTSGDAPDQVCDDDIATKSPKPVKKKSKKPPELSLTITEPRDDTPIPSPKSLSQGFRLDAGTDQTSQDKQQPLLEALTFPPGVSQPLSPLPPTKELKFPPGVSQPLSPSPKKTHAPKHIPAPLVLKPDSDLIVPTSPLNTLTFPEGVTKPISPLPKKFPKPTSSSLDSEKPLPYPAKPVSPLKLLHFPEGIPKPVSPLTKKPQESAFSKFSSLPKSSLPDVTDKADKDQKVETVEADAPEAKEKTEVSATKQTATKKPKPRITIPKPEDPSLQTAPTSLEPGKPSSPFTLKFPEGISKPVSPDPQKSQQPIFKLDEKTEKLSPEADPVPDSTKKDLPMKIPAQPVSPLKTISFPEGISLPISPTPEKETKPLFKPAPKKPIPPALEIPKTDDEISESSASLDKKADATKSAPSTSLVSTKGTETLTVLTFPAGVSKPISPMPQKTKFPSDVFKTPQPLTKSASSTDSLKTTPSAETPPSPTCKPNETIKAPLIPSDFFKTVHPGEKPPSLLRTKPASSAKEMPKTTESDTSKIYSPGHTTTLKTFKFPEGVSMPLSPLPPKAKSAESQSQIQKEQQESKIPVTSSHERNTIFTFSHFPRTNEAAKVGMPASPTLQKGTLSEPISPSPIKIKHTVDFPSDVFPCTKAHSPLIKSASSPTKAPMPSPKFGSSVTQVSSAFMKDNPPLPKIPSPLTQAAPVLPKPEDVTATEESLTSVSSGPKNDTKVPKSILATRLKIPPDTTSSPEKSPRTPSETKSTISQTHLTYSEVSKRFTPSPRLPDEICKEITATPPMTPPPEPELPSSATSTPKEKSTKAPSAQIQTSEVRSAARYSRGEAKPPKITPPSSEASSVTKDKSESSESKADSVPEISTVRRLRDLHQTEEDSHFAKDGAQSPRSGCDSPSKKMRRRKRR